jgi:putative AdoMet-dependent methyltransferase
MGKTPVFRKSCELFTGYHKGVSMSINWIFDEKVLPGVNWHDNDRVIDYDRKMSQLGDPKHGAAKIFTKVGLQKDWKIIDFGAGTGSFAIEAAKKCSMVYAIDISANMLKYAKTKAEQTGLNNIIFILSGFLSYEHKGNPVDAVFTTGAFHHLPDFWKQIALLKMNKIMQPNSKLYISDIIYSFDPVKYIEVFNEFISKIEKFINNDLLKDTISDLSKEYMTMDWILEEMLERAGFKVDNIERADEFFAQYVCIKIKEKYF